MCAWIVSPMDGLIEPAAAPEFYIDGVGAIERIGEMARFYLCSEQLPLEAMNGIPQQIVTVKIVRPLLGLPATIAQLAVCMAADQPPIVGKWPRLVR